MYFKPPFKFQVLPVPTSNQTTVIEWFALWNQFTPFTRPVSHRIQTPAASNVVPVLIYKSYGRVMVATTKEENFDHVKNVKNGRDLLSIWYCCRTWLSSWWIQLLTVITGEVLRKT
jgi:hypothetical protein